MSDDLIQEFPYRFKRTVKLSETTFDIEIDGIDGEGEVTVTDKDGEAYTLPYRLVELIYFALPKVKPSIINSKIAYKIAYAQLEKRFGLYPIGKGSLDSFKNDSGDDLLGESLPLRYVATPISDSRPYSTEKKNYFTLKFVQPVSNVGDCEWRLSHVEYPDDIIYTCPWDDLEQIATAVELMKDEQALFSLFALIYPQQAAEVAGRIARLSSGAGVVKKIEAWPGVEVARQINGFPLYIKRVPNSTLGKILRTHPYQNLIAYRHHKESYITTLYVHREIAVNLGVVLHLSQDTFKSFIPHDQSAFVNKLATSGDFENWTVFDSKTSQEILGREGGDILILLIPTPIVDELGGDLYLLQDFLRRQSSGENKAWF